MTALNIEALTSVQRADVYKAGTFAATLTRHSGGIEFAYLESYLAASGRPVATTLPLTDQPTFAAAGAVPPFFAGLLPEGRRLTALRRAVKTSADDELSLLLAVGLDTVGDVQVVPVGEAPRSVEPLVQVQRSWSEVRFADLLAEAGVIDPVGIAGIQDKASAEMITVPIAQAGRRYLLKIDPPEYPHLVLNEAFFLAKARHCGINVAPANVVLDADGRPGLLIQRFDRQAAKNVATQSLACEDACQVLGRWPADKYAMTSEIVVEALASRCAARSVAASVMFEQLCFAWLTGNGDVHAKNLSIVATQSGEWRVSPAYDLPSTVPYGDMSLALTISGRRRGISRNHLLTFASGIGLPDRAAVSVLDRLLERLVGLEDELRAGVLPFRQQVVADLAAELRNRRRAAQRPSLPAMAVF